MHSGLILYQCERLNAAKPTYWLIRRALIDAKNKIFLLLVSIYPYKTLNIPCKIMKLCCTSNAFAIMRVDTHS